ncbi:cytochrome P450 2D14-like isoform X1 [Alosa sapidissima]|uniref:cytochrome P450 2D14-like isoform X1 n=2 Tax=Alosa sapidissima TaxID=34773 RepID=UPI001C08DBF3|nr:cytochrome P450 2D14-like isoform X1 [Alosa sapidissima]
MSGWLLFLGLASAAIVLLLLLVTPQRGPNFPPGPPALPLLGNLLQLSMKNPMPDLDKIARRYGNVYSLFLGKRPAVMLHGLQAVREALMMQATDFAGRPQGLMINHVTDSKGLIMADYGVEWREHRRFVLSTMRNFGLGKVTMEQRILEETAVICSHLEKNKDTPINPQVLIHSAASNIICSVLFGTRYEYEDKVLSFIVNSFKENAEVANSAWAVIYDTLPMLRSLPLPFQKVFKNYDALKKHTRGIVVEHKQTRVPGEPRDVIDCYLDEMEKRGTMGSCLDEERLVMLLLDLHFAGTDTSSNTLLTAFLYLTTYRDAQVLCQQEIDSVLGERPDVSYNDRHQMPFVMATIHEIQRLANIAPLGVFHAATRSTSLMGYHIPQDTLVITNLTSVLYDESQWERPFEFYPAHFLNNRGEFVKPEAFLAFSAGPRVCLGEALARMELFLILVTLLHHFHFVWPKNSSKPDLTPVFGGIQAPKPFFLEVHPRKRKRRIMAQ